MSPLEEETYLTRDLIAFLHRSRNRLLGELDAVDAELNDAEARLTALELQQHSLGENSSMTDPPVVVQNE